MLNSLVCFDTDLCSDVLHFGTCTVGAHAQICIVTVFAITAHDFDDTDVAVAVGVFLVVVVVVFVVLVVRVSFVDVVVVVSASFVDFKAYL